MYLYIPELPDAEKLLINLHSYEALACLKACWKCAIVDFNCSSFVGVGCLFTVSACP